MVTEVVTSGPTTPVWLIVVQIIQLALFLWFGGIALYGSWKLLRWLRRLNPSVILLRIARTRRSDRDRPHRIRPGEFS